MAMQMCDDSVVLARGVVAQVVLRPQPSDNAVAVAGCATGRKQREAVMQHPRAKHGPELLLVPRCPQCGSHIAGSLSSSRSRATRQTSE